jgi:transcriptional regulator with XRE-family HTH domain
MEQTKPHHGRNIKRFREWFDIKQETLASELNWSQQKVSLLEQKEEIEDSVLEEVAKILKVPVDAIKKLDEEQAINFINNTFNHSGLFNRDCTLNFNPLDKIVELYERMIKDRDALIEELKKN